MRDDFRNLFINCKSGQAIPEFIVGDILNLRFEVFKANTDRFNPALSQNCRRRAEIKIILLNSVSVGRLSPVPGPMLESMGWGMNFENKKMIAFTRIQWATCISRAMRLRNVNIPLIGRRDWYLALRYSMTPFPDPENRFVDPNFIPVILLTSFFRECFHDASSGRFLPVLVTNEPNSGPRSDPSSLD
jgi:hypothetical protein